MRTIFMTQHERTSVLTLSIFLAQVKAKWSNYPDFVKKNARSFTLPDVTWKLGGRSFIKSVLNYLEGDVGLELCGRMW